jgi:hypothetical protein
MNWNWIFTLSTLKRNTDCSAQCWNRTISWTTKPRQQASPYVSLFQRDWNRPKCQQSARDRSNSQRTLIFIRKLLISPWGPWISSECWYIYKLLGGTRIEQSIICCIREGWIILCKHDAEGQTHPSQFLAHVFISSSYDVKYFMAFCYTSKKGEENNGLSRTKE